VSLGRPVEGTYATGGRGLETQRRWLGRLGGVSGDPGFIVPFVLSSFTCLDYPLMAKLRYPRAMRRSIRCLWADLGRRIDLVGDVTRLDVPVVLFAGRRDHITDLSLIELWHASLEAPEKRLEIVDDAGHLAPFEAPEAFVACLEALR